MVVTIDAAVPHATRCAQMVASLRRGYLYSEKRARDVIFATCEDLLNHGPHVPLLLARLIRDVSRAAKEASAGTGYHPPSWGIASGAVLNTMLHAGVLRDSTGAVVRPGLKAYGTLIRSLQLEYADSTEAYLIEYLIRDLGDVSTRDHRPLAHALFRCFDRDVPMDRFEDRVALLLSSLGDRVVLDPNGHYRTLSFPVLA